MPSESLIDQHVLRVHRALRPGFGTEVAVYGTIAVSGLIAVTSTKTETSAIVLVKVAATVIIFWAAHVFAGTVARMGEKDGADSHVGFRTALRGSLTYSLGMLSSAAIPALILLAGTTRLIPDELANDLALWSSVIILLFLGYVAFLLRGSSQIIRIVGALATASFGLAFVALKAFVQ
ncbi:hypothetical protein [Microbacterium pygmaeum]|uniref:hypothetical protein n=1 Tax=Microbacterium pygmaeum TaxID=370764 RepID=UPI000B8404CC|nr:hypothetical protein [Microbacterium pygmaeum]